MGASTITTRNMPQADQNTSFRRRLNPMFTKIYGCCATGASRFGLPRRHPRRLPVRRRLEGTGESHLAGGEHAARHDGTSLVPEMAAHAGMAFRDWCAGWWRTRLADGSGERSRRWMPRRCARPRARAASCCRVSCAGRSASSPRIDWQTAAPRRHQGRSPRSSWRTAIAGVVVGGHAMTVVSAVTLRPASASRRQDHRPERDVGDRRPRAARHRPYPSLVTLRCRRRAQRASRRCPGSSRRRPKSSIPTRSRSRSSSGRPSRSGSTTARFRSSTRPARSITDRLDERYARLPLHGRRAAPPSAPADFADLIAAVPDRRARRAPASSSPSAAGTCDLDNGVELKLPEEAGGGARQLVELDDDHAAARRDIVGDRPAPARPRRRPPDARRRWPREELRSRSARSSQDDGRANT